MALVIPATERKTSYSPVVATTAFPVGFALFDLADVAVFVDAVEVDSGDYTVTSAAGLTADGVYADAVATLDTGVSSVTVEVIGRRSPARASVFTEGAPVPASDLNRAMDVHAIEIREVYDWLNRIDPNLAAADEYAAQAAASAAEAMSFSRRTINAVAGTTHQFDGDDVNAIVDCQSGSSTVLTVPPNTTIAWSIGDQIDIRRAGAGLVTFAPGSGVTITSPHSYGTLPTRYGMATLVYMGSNVWALAGSLG